MAISFQPDQCLPRDPAGWGLWLSGHYREHLQLQAKCLALTTPIKVPDYDILGWRDEPELVQQWLVSHQSIHSQLRAATNVTGVDFSLVDFSDDEEFASWLDNHAEEHIILRQILGIS